MGEKLANTEIKDFSNIVDTLEKQLVLEEEEKTDDTQIVSTADNSLLFEQI